MGIILAPFTSAPPCASAPTITSAPTLSDTLNTCASAQGWKLDIDFSITGTQGTFEFEAWTKEWQDSESEPGSFSFAKRMTSVGSQNIETQVLYGTPDQGSGSVTFRRKAQVRVVPGSSANGAGPFCDTSETSTQLNRLAYSCAE